MATEQFREMKLGMPAHGWELSASGFSSFVSHPAAPSLGLLARNDLRTGVSSC